MRIGIITDIHENTHALEEALRLAYIQKCDEIACLGDIVGYDRRFYSYDSIKSARECIRLIRSNCRWVVAGNHDLFSAGRIPSWSDGFEYPAEWFHINSNQRKAIAGGKVWCYDGDAENDLEEEEIGFLRLQPESVIIEDSGFRFLLSHYFFPDFTGSTTHYVERGRHLSPHWEFMNLHEVQYSFSGHTHNHFTGFAYRNSGSIFNAFQNLPNDSFYLGKEKVIIALPPLSGEKGRTGFAIFDTDRLELSVLHFTPYN
jgi:predicted phosphodiesterase